MTFSYCQLKGFCTSDNQSGPRLWLVILEGREQCPTITVTPFWQWLIVQRTGVAIIRCSQTERLCPCLCVCVSVCIHRVQYVHICVGQHVCLWACLCVCEWKKNKNKKKWGRAVCDLAPSTVSEGVTIRSPSHSSRKADCAANCGLGGWRPTDRMESCNTKEKQFGSSTQ